MGNIKVVESSALSRGRDRRFVVIDEVTGEVLDDAQGYGYKTAQNAHRAYGYKSATPKQKKARDGLKRRVREWIAENRAVVRDIEDEAFYSLKDGEEFTHARIKEIIAEHGVEMPFTVAEFLRHW